MKTVITHDDAGTVNIALLERGNLTGRSAHFEGSTRSTVPSVNALTLMLMSYAVSLPPDSDYDATVQWMRHAADGCPGIYFVASTTPSLTAA
jgi:hypothetical protein